QIFERLAEFERTRDDLRGYIIGSLIYSVLLSLVGIGGIFIVLEVVFPKFAAIFSDPRMVIPTPMLIMLEVSRVLQNWWLPFAAGLFVTVTAAISYVRTETGCL